MKSGQALLLPLYLSPLGAGPEWKEGSLTIWVGSQELGSFECGCGRVFSKKGFIVTAFFIVSNEGYINFGEWVGGFPGECSLLVSTEVLEILHLHE